MFVPFLYPHIFCVSFFFVNENADNSTSHYYWLLRGAVVRRLWIRLIVTENGTQALYSRNFACSRCNNEHDATVYRKRHNTISDRTNEIYFLLNFQIIRVTRRIKNWSTNRITSFLWYSDCEWCCRLRRAQYSESHSCDLIGRSDHIWDSCISDKGSGIRGKCCPNNRTHQCRSHDICRVRRTHGCRTFWCCGLTRLGRSLTWNACRCAIPCTICDGQTIVSFGRPFYFLVCDPIQLGSFGIEVLRLRASVALEYSDWIRLTSADVDGNRLWFKFWVWNTYSIWIYTFLI